MDENSTLVPGAELPFALEEALEMYKTMVRVNSIDLILNSLQRQGRISFYMTNGGEEACQVGSCAALQFDDVIYPQYRELGTFLHRGFTIQQVLDQCMNNKDEAGKGRQMPVHYCDAKLNIQSVTSPLATQIPQAAGTGYAFRTGGEARCGVTYFGDGAASEGDAFVALNFAATLKSQTLFLVRNNGWAISTPSKEQYVGDGIAARAIAMGMRAIRVDGNDLAAVYRATKVAREFCVENGEPVLVEYMTYRQGHHSTSDDSSRYRPGDEVKNFSRSGLEPLTRTRMFLEKNGLWTEAMETELRDATRSEVMGALKVAEEKKFSAVREMFTDVWANEPPHLRRQRAELEEHIQRHSAHYAEKLKRFEA